MSIQIFKYICEYSLQIIFMFVFAIQKNLNNIHICIRSTLGSWIIFVFIFDQERNIFATLQNSNYSKNKERRTFSLNISLYYQYGKLQKGFDILSTIFRLLGSSKLGFDYFQIFKYIWTFDHICEYILQVIFLFIFVTQGVKNIIHICILRICLLQIIFVLVHQKNYSPHSG